MEDKTFELLTQLYNEFSQYRKESNVQFEQIDKRLNKIEFTIENDIKSDIKATLDGYSQLAEGQNVIKDQLLDIKSMVNNHDVDITVLKSVK